MCAATVSSAEVQAVLQEALQAQHCEDHDELGSALECYYKASCQLSYVLDLQDDDRASPLATVCQGLLEMYEQRMTVLKARQEAAKGPHWVQLDIMGQHTALTADRAASASASTCMGFPRAAAAAFAQQQLRVIPPPLHCGPPMAAAAADTTVGSSGLQHVFEEPSSPSTSTASAASLELLRSCQRAVSGSLDDVVGLETVKVELEEAVFLPLQHPHLFKGIRQPTRTFLLYGPPGTGKTLLVEKVAAEAGFVLLSISPSMVLSKWAGDSEKAISGVFELAKSFQPCIIFLDEVDSLGQSRGSNTDAGARRLLTELLIQFTRASEEEGVYVFGATNRMQDCDPALLRRFGRRIEVPLPDAAARAAFFAAVLARPELEAHLSTEHMALLADLTQGYSGSDLASVCRTAALAPVREFARLQRTGSKRRRGCSVLPLGEGDCGRHSCDDQHPSWGSPVGGSGSTGWQQQQQQLDGVMVGTVDAAAAEAPTAAAVGAGAGEAGSASAQTADRQQQQQQQSSGKLRKLVLADFEAAIAMVKPAAADAGPGVH